MRKKDVFRHLLTQIINYCFRNTPTVTKNQNINLCKVFFVNIHQVLLEWLQQRGVFHLL